MSTFTGIALVVGAVAAATLSSIRVTADRSGLAVRYGMLRWPRTHIATADIVAASAIDVRPSEWGGWGYRGSVRLMRQAAVVLRSGPGLRLDLPGDRTFVVTIDDPEGAATLLNAEIARLAARA